MKKIVFITGTRADFGKLKSLLNAVEQHPHFELFVFVTGMHLMKAYGYTLIEVEREGFQNIHTFYNHTHEATMDLTLAKTISGFSEYVQTISPDLIIIHGDRVEALAGATVGALNNILVGHIEGGEVSGTIDELLRHATSKMSHTHFVANEDAANRLKQMGELDETIFVVGSPDIDIMFSKNLPSLEEAKAHYGLSFEDYGIAMFHPVTTEKEHIARYAKQFVEALLQSDKNYVVVYPNNDLGSHDILGAYEAFSESEKCKLFPSIRFEYFLVLLKNASFIIGNSSAGIREAPYYGVSTVNIGTRQENRALHDHIVNTGYETDDIVEAIQNLPDRIDTEDFGYGTGTSSQQFIEILEKDSFWKIRKQKHFLDR